MRNLDIHWIFRAMKLSIFFWWHVDSRGWIDSFQDIVLCESSKQEHQLPSFAHPTLQYFPTWNNMDLNFFGKTIGERKATNIDKTTDCIPGIRKNSLATLLQFSYAYSSLQNLPPGMWCSLAAYSPNLISKNEVPVYKHDLSMFITTRQSMECHDQTHR